MKILITGATGFVGHQLALTLAERGNDINVLVRNPDSVHVPMHKNIRAFTGDITDKQSITAAIKECEQVYHTAALVKIFDKDPSLFHEINVGGTRNMLEKSLETGVKKFVFTSSCSVIGPSLKEPMCEDNSRITSFDNDYDITKFLAENLVTDYAHKGLFTVIVSPSKVFGPGIETHPISVNTVIKKFIKGNLTFIPKPGSLTANYCYIDDVVNGHILAMANGTGGEKYILGGENISFLDFFQTVRSLSGTKARLIETHEFFIKTWAALQWIQYKTTNKEPYVTEKGIRQIFCNKIFSSEKAIRQLGYQITPLREGLQETIQFLKNQSHA
nr:NAD-dependent epimerase/dehydratase family protein [uncultured Flavobacterium sp.]